MFARHLTYAPRESWFFKGLQAVTRQKQTKRHPFVGTQAAEQLGIGTSQVTALRFWLQATGLVEEQQGHQLPELTRFGELVWEHDPYLEDDTTLWWLHYHLVCQKDRAPTWYWLFNCGPTTFTKAEAVEQEWYWAVQTFAEQTIQKQALEKDVECFLRMYLPPSRKITPEDITVSPFSRLRILRRIEGGAMGDDKQEPRYAVARPTPERLHPLLLLSVLIDRQQHQRPGLNQVALTDILREPANAGRCFGLSAERILDLLAHLPQVAPQWTISLSRNEKEEFVILPGCQMTEVISDYYRTAP